MPTITLKNFLGFSSNKEAVFEQPALGSDCHNVLIDNGDLVNLPFELLKVKSDTIFTHGIIFKTFRDEFYVLLNDTNTGGLLKSDFPGEDSTNLEVFWFLRNVPDFLGVSIDAKNVNFIQAADWIIILGKRSDNQLDVPMLRYRVDYSFNPLGKIVGRRSDLKFNGVFKPITAETITTGDTILNSNKWDFAFSFMSFDADEARDRVNLDTNEVIFTKNLLKSSDFESSATLVGVDKTLLSDTKWRLTVNRKILTSATTPVVKMYAKADDQEFYYFITFLTDLTLVSNLSTNDILVFDVTFNNLGTIFPLTQIKSFQDLSDTAPLSDVVPILGAHDVPQQGFHAEIFKNKMYYSKSSIPFNTLQISARTPADELDTGKFTAYIERFEFIGKQEEVISGLIKFQGQLIIFKETETYVLTDDLDANGRIRLLFEDKGSVNAEGGKGYLVIEGRLIWVALNGIYSFNGAELQEISKPVREFLLTVPFENYSKVRAIPDIRYRVIYFCFGDDVDTLIYHYGTGLWTKRDPLRSMIIDSRSKYSTEIIKKPNKQDIYTINNKGIDLLGDINTPAKDVDNTRTWSWTSGVFDGGDLEKLKHWVFSKIMSVNFPTSNYQIIITAITEKGEFVIENFDALKPLGIHSNELRLRIEAKEQLSFSGQPIPGARNKFTNTPFRISGLQVQGHIKGKR